MYEQKQTQVQRTTTATGACGRARLNAVQLSGTSARNHLILSLVMAEKGADIVLVSEKSSRSSVWSNFQKVKGENGESFAVCKDCEKKLKYNGSTTSKSLEHQKRHQVPGKPSVPATQRTLDAHVIVRSTPSAVCSVLKQRPVTLVLDKPSVLECRS